MPNHVSASLVPASILPHRLAAGKAFYCAPSPSQKPLSKTLDFSEAGVTNLAVFLPLDKQIWAEELARCVPSGEREDKEAEIGQAGYDIRTAVKKLERLYE